MPTPKMFRIYGTIARHQVMILVDGGSTHNFIQARLAVFLHLDQVPTATMRVMIGKNITIDCDTKCPLVPILIQGHSFSVDLYQLPIGGTDIVLGVQWFKLLGSVTTDYASLTMSFNYLKQPISLHADIPLCPSLASAQQQKRFSQTHGISALYHLTHIPDPAHLANPVTTPPTSSSHPALAHLLHRYEAIFQEPHQLPPPRNITHRIHLLLNTNPVNVKPYRCPYS